MLGFLALTAHVGILPIYVYGTYEALPKGSNMLHGRDVGARVGRFLSVEELEAMTKGMPKSEGYRLIAAFVRHEIENLRDGTRHAFDATSLRRRWRAERRTTRMKRSVPRPKTKQSQPATEGKPRQVTQMNGFSCYVRL